jgi:uncharacterized protein YjbI with pentapeptide repeats
MRKTIGWLILLSIALTIAGLAAHQAWLTLLGSLASLLLSLWSLWAIVRRSLTPQLWQTWTLNIAILGAIAACFGLLYMSPLNQPIAAWFRQLNWQRLAASAVLIGGIGQISIAVIALYIAWKDYVTFQYLTAQQNTITQQQTIDAYCQGISQLSLDLNGLIRDSPMERLIAAGRTAAILNSVDAHGKARVLRFLTRSNLLTPLKRDRILGRVIIDGAGGYVEDRIEGIRVIDLDVMLAGTDLSGTDLRWADLSDINLIRADLSRCDLVRANLSRTILCDVPFAGSDMRGTRLFYGSAKAATPRTRVNMPNYQTGAYTGAVIEGADFTDVLRLSDEQRYYCCAWGGSNTRKTIPGGCEGIPNRLEEEGRARLG